MHDLELADEPLPELVPLEVAPRPLTAGELLDALDTEVGRAALDLRSDSRDDAGDQRHAS